MKSIIILLQVFTLLGCVSAINQKSSNNHARAAVAATQAGDWDLSRRHWAKAVVNANLANQPDQTLAVLNYEYGRALGVTCFFEEAEKYLTKAYEQDKKTNGPSYNDLIELARLNIDQKQWGKSIAYFEKAMPLLQKINAPTGAPHAYADILDEYALALERSGKNESSDFHQRAEAIRKKYPEGHSITERTPYGAQCTN